MKFSDDAVYLIWQYYGVFFILTLMWCGLPIIIDCVFISMAWCLFLFMEYKSEPIVIFA